MGGPASTAGRRWARAVAWAGTGTLGGSVLMAVAVLFLNAGEGGNWDMEGAWVLAGLLAVVALFGGVRWDTAWTTSDARPGEPPEAVERRRRRQRRSFRLWVTVALALATALAYTAFPADLLLGMEENPDAYGHAPRATGIWLAACAVPVGLLLMLGSPGPVEPRPWRGSLPFLASGALAVVLTVSLAGLYLYPRQPHTVAEGLGEPAPVPGEVTRVGWSWEPPQDTWVTGVRTGPHGPVLLLADGAVALDGRSGEELWSFRRPRDDDHEVWSEAWVDDGRVYVRHTPPERVSDDAPERTVTVLDPATGAIVDEYAEEAPERGGSSRTRLGEVDIDRWFSSSQGGSVELTATDTRTGAGLWNWSREFDPDEYGSGCGTRGIVPFPDRMVVQIGCVDSDAVDGHGDRSEVLEDPDTRTAATLVAVDVQSGEEVWEHSWEREGAGTEEPVLVPADRSSGGGEPVVAVRHSDWAGATALFDPATGEEVPGIPEQLGPGGSSAAALLDADTAGAFLLEDGDPVRYYRADASAETVATADLAVDQSLWEDGIPRAHLRGATAVDDAALVPIGGADVVVAPFGEETAQGEGPRIHLAADEDERLSPGDEPYERGMRVTALHRGPGSVVALLSRSESSIAAASRIEGLVP